MKIKKNICEICKKEYSYHLGISFIDLKKLKKFSFCKKKCKSKFFK